MNQILDFDSFKFYKNVNLKNLLNTRDDSGIGYILEVDKKYPDETKRKKMFCICPEDKFSSQDKINDKMNKTEVVTYKP